MYYLFEIYLDNYCDFYYLNACFVSLYFYISANFYVILCDFYFYNFYTSC